MTDDGTGRVRARPTGGLADLRFRAQQYGGTLTVASPARAGTRLVWRVPLPAD